jgi:competence protein ComFC
MIWEWLVDFVYPKFCVGCGKLGVFLCVECGDRLDFVDQICPECGEASIMGWTHHKCRNKHSLDGMISIYEYREPVARAIIDGIKYQFNKELVSVVLKDFVFETGVVFDALVPVPLFFYRENWRGFNQAEEIAKVVGDRIKVPVEKILKRVRNTKQQALMKDRKERVRNISGAFEVSKKYESEKLKTIKILLVDDVFTSGANMRECAKVLKGVGVKQVWGLSLSH